MSQKRRWTFKLSFLNILILLTALLVNVFGNYIAETFRLPFWLDSVGTILAAGILGPLGGALAGSVSGVICTVMASEPFLYVLVNVLIAVIVGVFYPGDTSDSFQLLCAAAIVAIMAIVFSVPINLAMRNGYIGNIWGDALFDMLWQDGNSRLFCTILGQSLIDFPDKVISFFLATGITKLGYKLSLLKKEEDA